MYNFETFKEIRENYKELWMQLALFFAAVALIGVGYAVFGAATTNIYLKCYWVVGLCVIGCSVMSVANPHLGALAWFGLWILLLIHPWPQDPEFVKLQEVDPEANRLSDMFLALVVFIATGAAIFKCRLGKDEEIAKIELAQRRRRERQSGL